MQQVLVVHPDKDMILALEELLDEVQQTKGCALSWSHARTQREAKEKAGPRRSFDLVVTSLEISEDDKASAAAGEQRRRGLELVRELRDARPEMAAILITGYVDSEVVAFTQSQGVGLVQEGAGFQDQLQSEIIRHLGLQKPEAPRRMDLEISLSADHRSSWRFVEGGKDLGNGQLDVRPKRLIDLVQDSRDVRIGDHHFENDLKKVGEALADELFQATPLNLEFRDRFNFFSGKVGIENIRVRFAVQDTLHPIAVEALKRIEEDRAWMLKTAVYRCQALTDGRAGLFQDEQTREQPINFLIIQADVPHDTIVDSEDLNLKLEPLPNVEKEVTEVVDLLSKLKEKGGPVGNVRVINRESVPAGGSFKQLVEDVLNEGKWHVLHYAGHTHYDFQREGPQEIGYLFYPRDDGFEPVRIKEVAWSLRKADTRFVFLSSCEGGQQDFIYHLSKVGVPAIMGFLWKVYDPDAKEYAKSFYWHLIGEKERSLEYACLEAKKERKAKSNNPIWASAVLVMQVGV
jgi:CheY-like chemotaxis protein